MIIFKGLIILSVLIFIHELGHFIAARIFGVRVLQFAIGFGPTVISKVVGHTKYSVRALPIGGFVQMHGEDGEEGTEDPDSFDNKSVFSRFCIVAAGPAINILLALAILPAAYMIGISTPAYQEDSVRIGYVHEGSEAHKAGLLPGSQINSISNHDVSKWNAANMLIADLDSSTKHEVTGTHNGEPFTKQLKFAPMSGLHGAGVEPIEPVLIGSVVANSPADKAGLLTNDLLLKVEGKPVLHIAQYMEYLQLCADQGCVLDVLRGEETTLVTVHPTKKDDIYRIGFLQKQHNIIKKYPFVEAMTIGVARLQKLTNISVSLFMRLFKGSVSSQEVGGPITAMKSAGSITSHGLGATAAIIAFLSLQIGLFNLIPFPALDGGALAILSVEAVIRRPLPKKLVFILQVTGMCLLFGLMFFSVLFDIFVK